MLKEQEWRREKEERERRRNNIIITGLDEKVIKNKEAMEGWIKENIGVTINSNAQPEQIWKAIFY